MKTKAITVFVFFALASLTFAKGGSTVKSRIAEIFISSDVELTVKKDSSSTAKATNAPWAKDKIKKTITASAQVSSDKMKVVKFTFIPEEDGSADLTLRTNFFRDKDNNITLEPTLFDDLKVNEELVPNGDFESGKTDWKGASDIVESPFSKFKGDKCAMTTYNKVARKTIAINKGVPVTISVSAAMPPRSMDFKTVDIRKNANMAYTDKGLGFTPLKNFSLKTFEESFYDIPFDIIDSSSNEGKSLIEVTKKTGAVVIDLSKENLIGKYIYILNAAGNNITHTDYACGQVIVYFKDGSTADFWIRKNREAGSVGEAPQYWDKSKPVYIDDAKNSTGVLYLTFLSLKDMKPIEKIKFISTGWYVAGITVSSKQYSISVPYEFSKDDWRPIDMSNLDIKEGSALDLSETIDEGPAGKFGKAKISKDGHFEFENRAGVPVKFQGTNWRPGDGFGRTIKTREDIDKLAKMCRKQGYNLIRWRISMRKDEFESPYKLKEYNKDLYDYFFFAMAREGVYSHFNLSSHDLGNPDFTWDMRKDVKVKMFFGDPQTREDWKKLVKMELNLVNKYTGKKWKEDLSIVSTEYFNEIELGPMGGMTLQTEQWLNEKFQKYLENKYKTVDAWKSAMKKEGYKFVADKPINSFSDAKRTLTNTNNPDYARFIIEAGRDMQKFCEQVLKDEGFNVPIHQHNCIRTIAYYLLSAEAGSYMALNVYHLHPSAFMDMGSVVSSDSSITKYAEYWRAAASKRISGRPMALTEWQHCHWNPYKYEAGVLFPAYSAFQGFENLTVHDVAIANRAGSLGCFEVGGSPVFRANEFLSHMLFFRGDVKKSPHRIDVVYDKDFIDTNSSVGTAMNTEQSKLALLTGFAISFPDARKHPQLEEVKITAPDGKISPVGYAETFAATNFSGTGSVHGKFNLAKEIEDLKKNGIIPEKNISNPAEGIFQTDTGEITMRAKEQLVKVVTPKTEAVALIPDTKNERLNLLTVKSTSVPAAVAITSVDKNLPLSKSQRMVLVYNTDNIDTNFKVSKSRTVLISRGSVPILLKVGKLSAEFLLPKSGGNYALYSLKINGERIEKIPAEIADGVMKIEIDTSKTKEPAVFFEIVRE